MIKVDYVNSVYSNYVDHFMTERVKNFYLTDTWEFIFHPVRGIPHAFTYLEHKPILILFV